MAMSNTSTGGRSRGLWEECILLLTVRRVVGGAWRGSGGPTCRSAESLAPPTRPAAFAAPGASVGCAAGGAAPTVR